MIPTDQITPQKPALYSVGNDETSYKGNQHGCVISVPSKLFPAVNKDSAMANFSFKFLDSHLRFSF